MNLQEPIIIWNEKTGETVCELRSNFGTFIGKAKCHEDDDDMKSRLTGAFIAQTRAEIKFFKAYIKYDLQPRLNALNEVYSSMVFSKEFNAFSYEAKRLRKHIFMTQNDIQFTKNAIKETQEGLVKFLAEKDAFYQRIRENRQKAENK